MDLITVAIGVIGVGLYFLPSILAFNRETDNRWLVLVINLFFGGTFVGWFLALYLTLRKPTPTPTPTSTPTPAPSRDL
ncbi:superinfection immunity protein [Streptomyces sp. NPDC090741]|uniref:superinfection immunity protein n=1 Tax=Streptomyces sp. NPDC090741 TaxID=3365967 RepID=UPI003821A29C